MINADLLSYIKQAQLAGKSIEVIKQELATGGWNAADVAEALQSLSVGATAAAPVVAAAGGMGMKAIITILALVVLVGGGYFAYSKYKQPSMEQAVNYNQEQTVNTSPTPTTPSAAPSGAPSFICKDLVPDNEIKVWTGYDISTLDARENNESSKNYFSCSWDGKTNDNGTTVKEKWGTAGVGVSIQISWEKFNRFPISTFKRVIPNITEVSGVGSAAYYVADDNGGINQTMGFNFLSTNGKYQVIINDGGALVAQAYGSTATKSGTEARINLLKDLAKVIDITLSKN